MGDIIHSCIVVTSTDDDEINKLHTIAIDIFSKQLVTAILILPANGFKTFFIASTGSKSGWTLSENYNINKIKFINIVKDMKTVEFEIIEYGIDFNNLKGEIQ